MDEQKGANIQTNRQVDEQKRDKQTNGQTGGQTKKGQTDKRTDPLTRRLLYRFVRPIKEYFVLKITKNELHSLETQPLHLT